MKKQDPWIFGMWTDIAVLMAGLWAIPAFVLFKPLVQTELILFALFIIQVVVGGAHSICGALTVWGRETFRKEVLQERKLIFYLVFFFLGACICVILGLNGVAYSWFIVGATYFVFSTWHLWSHNFGVLSLYRFKLNESANALRIADQITAAFHGVIALPIVWYFFGMRYGSLLNLTDFHEPTAITVTLGLGVVFTIWNIGLFLVSKSLPRLFYGLMLAAQIFVCVEGSLLAHGISLYVSHWFAEVALIAKINASEKDSLSLFKRLRFPIALIATITLGICFELFLNNSMTWRLVELDPSAIHDLIENQTWGRWLTVILAINLFFRASHFLHDRFIFRRSGPGFRILARQIEAARI